MPGTDEYGDIGRVSGTQWATMDTVLPQKDLHIANTKVGPGGTVTFWLHQPRPQGVSLEEWEQITQDRWDRIFRKERA